MILGVERRIEFYELSKPLIEFLNNNCHPHMSIHITSTQSTLLEGIAALNTEEPIKD